MSQRLLKWLGVALAAALLAFMWPWSASGLNASARGASSGIVLTHSSPAAGPAVAARESTPTMPSVARQMVTVTAAPQVRVTRTLTPTAAPKVQITPAATVTSVPQVRVTRTLTPTAAPKVQITPVVTATRVPQTLTPTVAPKVQVTPVVTATATPQAPVAPVATATAVPQVQVTPVATGAPEVAPPSLPVTGAESALEAASGLLPLAALLLLAIPALIGMRSRGR